VMYVKIQILKNKIVKTHGTKIHLTLLFIYLLSSSLALNNYQNKTNTPWELKTSQQSLPSQPKPAPISIPKIRLSLSLTQKSLWLSISLPLSLSHSARESAAETERLCDNPQLQ
jgi:hypothetical protein